MTRLVNICSAFTAKPLFLVATISLADNSHVRIKNQSAGIFENLLNFAYIITSRHLLRVGSVSLFTLFPVPVKDPQEIKKTESMRVMLDTL